MGAIAFGLNLVCFQKDLTTVDICYYTANTADLTEGGIGRELGTKILKFTKKDCSVV